ncbi:GLPGLI family protein [Sediminibacterium soli]|uniref:GLPGLI family protein n=1 Tax=Sediminibacterium soli TaxID=2698829 RepID=UPI00137B6A98|nr:GLPGLI family protein [Sediminibacterium soli]NCI47641.1 GLPGLI family protein [Sediminibacterium soli]
MKRVFIMVLALLGGSGLYAQIKEGTIVYERRINMHRTIQNEQMRAMIPEFRTSKHMLLFSDSVSVYKLVPEDEAPDPFAGGGGGVRMIMRGAADGGDLYKNFSQAKSVQTSELAGKNYLIVDSIRQQPWKLYPETKQVLGHTCRKAVRKMPAPVAAMRTISMVNGVQRDSGSAPAVPAAREVEVIAWYADNIITPAGPEGYGQLPGAILQLDFDNGQNVITAVEIREKVDQKELKEPRKGKIVTQAAYRQLMQDLMNTQMQSMPGGGMRMRFGN